MRWKPNWSINSMIRSGLVLALLALAGCSARPDIVVVMPDSPVLILDIRGEYAHLAAYSEVDNEMVEVGWVHLTEYRSWSLLKFDWEAKIARKAREGEHDAGTDGSTDP